MKLISWFLGVVFVISADLACADNFRCPNGKIVSTGDSISAVAAKCDAPASLFRREEPVFIEESRGDRAGVKAMYIEVQEWTYNQGSTLLHTLIFRNGILSEVRTGGFVE